MNYKKPPCPYEMESNYSLSSAGSRPWDKGRGGGPVSHFCCCHGWSSLLVALKCKKILSMGQFYQNTDNLKTTKQNDIHLKLCTSLSFLGSFNDPSQRGLERPRVHPHSQGLPTPPFVKNCQPNASVDSSCAQPPPGYDGAFAHLLSPGGGAFANFALPGGRAFAKPGAIPQLLTRTRFPIRI